MTKHPLFPIIERLWTQSEEIFWQNLQEWSRGGGLKIIFTPNTEQLVQADQHPAFLSLLLQADVLLPDGNLLVRLAQKLHRQGQVEQRVQQRITGVDTLQWWLREAHGTKTFLLGGFGEVATDLARSVDSTGEWCRGTYGYLDVKQPTPAEEQHLQQQIAEFSPQVIFVGFGAPYQEQWIIDHRGFLQKNGVRVAMVCGGAFDILSPTHRLQRAPSWMQRAGLEWLFRLVQEPWRWRRQLIALIAFQKISRELIKR